MCTYNLVLDDQLVSEAESLLTNKGVTLQISARVKTTISTGLH